MASYNKVFLMGNLTRNPEIRYTNNQTAICSFGIAVNQGTHEKPETYFGECVCFGKTAEIIPRFTGKGSSVLVDGSLKNDQWQDRKTGETRSKTRIYVQNIKFLDQPEGNGHRTSGARYEGDHRYSREDCP